MVVLLMSIAAFIAAAVFDQPLFIGVGLVFFGLVCWSTIKNGPRR